MKSKWFPIVVIVILFLGFSEQINWVSVFAACALIYLFQPKRNTGNVSALINEVRSTSSNDDDEEVSPFEEADVKKVLGGPGSEHLVIDFTPNWQAIEEDILSKVKGWKGFPKNRCTRLMFSYKNDFITGMCIGKVTEHYWDGNKIQHDVEDFEMDWEIPTVDEEGDERLPLDSWCYKALRIKYSWFSLEVGFKLGISVTELDSEKALASYPIGSIISELRKMERLALGSATQMPLNSEKIFKEDKDIKCEYDQEANPYYEAHEFSNKYIKMRVHYKTRPSVFTQVRELNGLDDQEFAEKYYEVEPLKKEVKQIQEKLSSLHYAIPSSLFLSGELNESQLKSCNDKIEKWERGKGDFDKDLSDAITLISKELESTSPISVAENSFLPNMAYELSDKAKYVESKEKFGSIEVHFKKDQLDVHQPDSDIKFTLTSTEVKDKDYSSPRRGDYDIDIKIVWNGEEVFEARIPMNYDEFYDRPLGYESYSFAKFGKVKTCKHSDWFVQFIQIYFEIMSQKSYQELKSKVA